MKYKKIACLLISGILFAPTANATSLYVAGGYNFIPNSYYASLGYRAGPWGVEAMLMTMGREEPTTHKGPEASFDLLGYMPWIPVFVRGGLVNGWNKHGYNVGIGADIPLDKHWALRVQDIHFRVTEDIGEGPESEHQFSLGLRYRF